MSKFSQATIAAAASVALFGGALALIAPVPAEAFPATLEIDPYGGASLRMPYSLERIPVEINDYSAPEDDFNDDLEEFFDIYFGD